MHEEARPDDQLEVLLQRVEMGPAQDRRAALATLADRVRADPTDAVAFSHYGIALSRAGRALEAAQVHAQLVATQPDVVAHRVNLAISHIRLGNRRLAAAHARVATERGDDAERSAGRQLLGWIERKRRQEDADGGLRRRQLAALAQRRRRTPLSEDEAVLLARRLMEVGLATGGKASLHESAAVLEELRERVPDSIVALELLATLYLRLGQDEIDDVLARLERLAPDSSVIQAFRPGRAIDRNAWAIQQHHSIALVQQLGSSREPAVRDAAVDELGRLVAADPASVALRAHYAMALMLDGRAEAALEQAERALADDPESHDVHFHVAQVFRGCGDEARGRSHLRLAREVARDERERADVDGVLAMWEERAAR